MSLSPTSHNREQSSQTTHKAEEQLLKSITIRSTTPEPTEQPWPQTPLPPPPATNQSPQQSALTLHSVHQLDANAAGRPSLQQSCSEQTHFSFLTSSSHVTQQLFVLQLGLVLPSTHLPSRSIHRTNPEHRSRKEGRKDDTDCTHCFLGFVFIFIFLVFFFSFFF